MLVPKAPVCGERALAPPPAPDGFANAVSAGLPPSRGKRLQTLNQMLSAVYRAAQGTPVAEFQNFALALLREKVLDRLYEGSHERLGGSGGAMGARATPIL